MAGRDASASTRSWRRTTQRSSTARSRSERPCSGVNARDLATFEIDRRAQLELSPGIPRDRVVVAESGIDTRAQGAAAELAGADAILVGSALMRAADPAAKLARAPLAPTRQGLRPHARGGRGRGRRGRRRPPRLRARAREPPCVAAACCPCLPRRSRLPSGSARRARRRPISTRCTRSRKARSVDARRRSTETATRSLAFSIFRGARRIQRTGSARGASRGQVVLAGGLGPENVADAIAAVRPWAVDATSSLETEPGVKDHDRISVRGGGALMSEPDPQPRHSARTAAATCRRR